jgi:hypothetical protein
MNGTCRALSFPGTAHIPACRVREDSPHIKKFQRLARDIRDRIPDIERGELKAFTEDKPVALIARTGLMFDVAHTSTILKRIVASMGEGGRPSFYNREMEIPGGIVKGTAMMPSFWGMVRLMAEDAPNTGIDDMMDLEEQGVLVRSRKAPIAIRAPPGGLCLEEEGSLYLLPNMAVPMKDVIMLCTSGAAGLLAEIIKVEAGYEAAREGSPFCGQKEAKIRGMMSRKFRYEVFMSLKDMQLPIDRLEPQS